MKYCSECGNPVSVTVPPGDNRPRHVCGHCGTIHYQNPRMVVGALATWEGRILLCRRGIEPRHGYWTLPAGFMENGESMSEGAARETLEEACATIRIIEPYALVSVPHINQVQVIYRAELLSPHFAPGEESLEVKLFEESSIPWDELAFRSITLALKRYFEDIREGRFRLHHEVLL